MYQEILKKHTGIEFREFRESWLIPQKSVPAKII